MAMLTARLADVVPCELPGSSLLAGRRQRPRKLGERILHDQQAARLLRRRLQCGRERRGVQRRQAGDRAALGLPAGPFAGRDDPRAAQRAEAHGLYCTPGGRGAENDLDAAGAPAGAAARTACDPSGMCGLTEEGEDFGAVIQAARPASGAAMRRRCATARAKMLTARSTSPAVV